MADLRWTDVPQQSQRQDSMLDQLDDLLRWANRLGLWDAADWLTANRRRVQRDSASTTEVAG